MLEQSTNKQIAHVNRLLWGDHRLPYLGGWVVGWTEPDHRFVIGCYDKLVVVVRRRHEVGAGPTHECVLDRV